MIIPGPLPGAVFTLVFNDRKESFPVMPDR